MNKQLFIDKQDELLWLANTDAGRYLLGVEDKDPITKITPNSWHIIKDYKNNKPITQARFFCYERIAKILLPQLVKMDIYEREYNKKIEDKYAALLHFSGLKFSRSLPNIYLATTIFYAGSGDGTVRNNDLNFTTCRDASTGTGAGTGAATGRVECMLFGGDSNYYITRDFFPADTSAIGSDKIVSAGTVNITTEHDLQGSPTGVIVATTQASTTALATTDFGSVGSTALTDVKSYAFDDTKITHTLNGTGLAAVSLTGFTKMGLRENSKDVSNVAPVGAIYQNVYFSEQTDTANDPYYELTYAASQQPQGYALFVS